MLYEYHEYFFFWKGAIQKQQKRILIVRKSEQDEIMVFKFRPEKNLKRPTEIL